MKNIDLIVKSILAGCCIGLGGYVYLTVGGIVGAVLFSFGLITVVSYGLNLFTGKSGFVRNWDDVIKLFGIILIFNAIGCGIVSLISTDAITASALTLVQGRLNAGLLTNFLMAIPCGFIMTCAVEFASGPIETKNWLPLLFGVPMFIMCGFRHSIADAFYYCCAFNLWSIDLLLIWIVIVIGNFIGCNIYRFSASLRTPFNFKIKKNE